MLVQVEEIVALEKLVAELREGHALRGVTAETLLYGILAHHVVDSDELADVSGKVDEGVVLHPVVVVDKFCGVRRVGIEIKEPAELCLDAFDVVTEGLLVEKVALRRFHRRVSYHTGCSTHKSVRLVPAVLEMLENHDTDQMAYVK